MRASVLTLAVGECVPWHYHSTITDSFVCLEGPMEVETRAPRVNAGQNPELFDGVDLTAGRCGVILDCPGSSPPAVGRPPWMKLLGLCPVL
jgi:hypothetical protein